VFVGGWKRNKEGTDVKGIRDFMKRNRLCRWSWWEEEQRRNRCEGEEDMS
jgi:hypothetical protein